MSSFPSPTQFNGSYLPNATSVQQGGQSTYDGSIAVTLLSRADVQQALPLGFDLAARTDGVTSHPVVHLIGYQRHPMILENGVLYPAADLGYQELIVLIPYVVRPPGTKWHNFVARMYLNDVAAIQIGNSVYAYAKEFAILPETHAANLLTARALPLLLGDVFNSEVAQTGPWSSSSSASAVIPSWNDVRTLFAMPFVGADVDAGGAVTRIVCSYWEWNYANVFVAPATSAHKFLKVLRTGMSTWVGKPTGPPEDAILLRGLRWRLAIPPQACQF